MRMLRMINGDAQVDKWRPSKDFSLRFNRKFWGTVWWIVSGLYGRPWSGGDGPFIVEPTSSCNPQRATIKAHPTTPHPLSPLQTLMGFSQVDVCCNIYS